MSEILQIKNALDSLSGSDEIKEAIKTALDEIDTDLNDHGWVPSDESVKALEDMKKVIENGSDDDDDVSDEGDDENEDDDEG